MSYFFVDYCYTVIESETLFVLKYDEYTYDDRRYESCLRLKNCCASIAFEYAKIIIVLHRETCRDDVEGAGLLLISEVVGGPAQDGSVVQLVVGRVDELR